ncbi:chemotaxis response regulator protein-glutamate methylesterase [Singulisphaera sp. Ch08]|uniref:Protein-glutamate methylesterase/protein-glutamine glutaminase n=1 Tax=Singulisphaera sp. Ch08 TaxID=3120278 RepID=A0AAU7CIG0_9BACT
MDPTEPQPVRVLVVDDSALMRKLLGDLLRSSTAIEVVGSARDGAEALELAERLRPDLVTLDVEMPGMSGLEVLPALLKVHPVPVVMVSALTQEGAEVTLTALELGAVDFLAKPDRHQVAGLKESRDLLISKVLSAAKSRVRPTREREVPARRVPPPAPRESEAPPAVSVGEGLVTPCILIGISTGGPQALAQVLPVLTPPLPPILIVQHMPAKFTYVFAERLSRQCSLPVKEAEQGDRVLPGAILIAPGGRHMTLTGSPPSVRVTLADGPLVSGHKPSVDMLFQSGARVYGAAAIGIIMTGMGRDGVEGCKKILDAGGQAFGQDEQTSVVYGMNKAAFQEHAVQSQFALLDLPALIQRLARGRQ